MNQPSAFWFTQKAGDLSIVPLSPQKPGRGKAPSRASRQATGHAVAQNQPYSQRQELPEHIYFHVPGACVPKPRQSQGDKWKKRPCVLRYRAWADKAREEMRKVAGVSRLETARKITLHFYIPMPDSWSRKKKAEMRGTPNRIMVDIDNLGKAALDSLIRKDQSVYQLTIHKEWAIEGQERTEIYITT